jgi:hypothetical protein
VELAVRFLDRQVVDGSMAQAHQAMLVEFPVLIPIGTEPAPRIVVPFVGEAHGDAVAFVRPDFLDEAVILFACPFAGEESDDLGAAVMKSARLRQRLSSV